MTEQLVITAAEADSITAACSVSRERLGERVAAVAAVHLAHGNASGMRIHAAVLAANPLASRISGYSSGSVSDALSAYGVAHDYLAAEAAREAYGDVLAAIQAVRVKPLREAWTAALVTAKATAKDAEATPRILAALELAIDAAEAEAARVATAKAEAKAEAARLATLAAEAEAAEAAKLAEAEAEAEAARAALAGEAEAEATAAEAEAASHGLAARILADLAAMREAVASLTAAEARQVLAEAMNLASTAEARATAEAVAEAPKATPGQVAKARREAAKLAKAEAEAATA